MDKLLPNAVGTRQLQYGAHLPTSSAHAARISLEHV
jgi:hypothetical protein